MINPARIAALAVMLTGTPLVQGQDLEPAPWYIGVHAGVATVDAEAGEAEDGTLIRVNLGRQLSRTLTLELEASGGSVELGAAPDLDQTDVSLNLMIVNREPSWNPYFLVGFGAFDHDVPLISDTGAMAQVGIGGMWDLNGYGLMLRADVRYRYSDLDFEVIEPGQAVATIGLDFPFGR